MLRRIRMAKRAESGFTLIELLIVIVILGVLAAVVVFAVGGINDRGVDSACRADLATVSTAAEAYEAKNGVYAPNIETLVEEKLLKSMPSTKNYQIDYALVGKGSDQRAQVTSTSCDVQGSSSAPTSDIEDTQEARDRYCKTFDTAIQEFSQGVSFQALDVDEFARATKIFERVQRAATNDIRSDWTALTGVLHSMQEIVAATGLNREQLKELSAGQLPSGFTQEQWNQLGDDLAQQLQGKSFQRAAQRITEHARSTCGMNI